MTPQGDGTLNPSILVGSRRRRVAAGSGSTIQDVNNLISKFEMMRQFVKRGLGGIDRSARGQGRDHRRQADRAAGRLRPADTGQACGQQSHAQEEQEQAQRNVRPLIRVSISS